MRIDKTRVLLVQESARADDGWDRLLTDHRLGLQLVPVGGLDEAKAEIARRGADLLLVEGALLQRKGFERLSHTLVENGGVPFIVLVDSYDPAAEIMALRAGAQDYLVRDRLDAGKFWRAARYAIERNRAALRVRRRESRHRALLEAIPDLILRISRQGTYLDISSPPDFVTLAPIDEIVGMNLSETTPPDVAERSLHYIQLALETGEIQIFEYQIPDPGGTRYYEARLVVSGEDEVLAIVRDITDRRNAEKDLWRYAERLDILRDIDQAILAAHSPEAITKEGLGHLQSLIPFQRGSIAIFDLESRMVTVFATHAQENTPRGTGALLSTEMYGDLSKLQRGDVLVKADLQTASTSSPDVEFLRREGVRAYLRAPLITEGELIGVMNLESERPDVFNEEHAEIAREVADLLAIAIWQARLFAQIQHLAITDELTNLYNRRHFFELAQREFDRVKRYGGALSAIMLDIDQFKLVNDTHGHAVGDEVLRKVAARLNASIRETDILGRYGGDEFAILLPETDLIPAHQLAERLRHWIAKTPVDSTVGRLDVTISLGVASLTEDIADLATLIDLADADMYASKQVS
jgi:diguanylate cyclase (GGDEF)-like protein/PAS domain S-box-containing protein